MNQYERFSEAVDALVSLVEARYSTLGPDHYGMSRVDYAIAFQTVAVNPGRRMGKTEYIRRRLRPGQDIAIAGTKAIADNTFADMKRHTVVASYVADLDPQLFPQVDRVYIDEPSLVFRAGREYEVYAKLIARGARTFILLGE